MGVILMSENICLNCPKTVATKKNKYCSQECYRSHRAGQPRKTRKDKGTQKVEYITRPCVTCGKPVTRAPWAMRDTVACDLICWRNSDGPKETGKAGGGRPPAIGGDGYELAPGTPPEIFIAIEKYGMPRSEGFDKRYKYYSWPEHPHSSPTQGRIYEHRAVAFEYFGLEIKGQHIDHIDNDRTNNAWGNLQVLSPSDHGTKTNATSDGTKMSKWLATNYPDVFNSWTIFVGGGLDNS